jgi:uncharacterized protein YunC (DUF1805 family)
MTQDFPWRKLYQDAMLELDRIKLQEKIEAAHAAMQQRMEELTMGGYYNSDSLEERQSLADAMHGIRTLRKLELKPLNEAGSPRGNAQCGEAL